MASCTLTEIASLIGAELVLPGAGEAGWALGSATIVSGVAPLERAKTGELSFLTGGAFEKFLPGTRATAVIVGPAHAGTKVSCALLVHKNPYWAYARAASQIVGPE
ncbi:MAG: UDP-3-O-[3-hydroxymyristoyl] glucosamine N-acyltransferase, LpxD, partial [Pseudomonadota bacterium]